MTVELIIQEKEKKTTYTPALKKAVYKWRENHVDTYRAYANKWANENYYKHADKYKEIARLKYREKQLLSGIPVKPRGRPKKVKEDNFDLDESLGKSI